MGEIFAQHETDFLDIKQFSNLQCEKLHIGLWFFVNRLSTIKIMKFEKCERTLHQLVISRKARTRTTISIDTRHADINCILFILHS